VLVRLADEVVETWRTGSESSGELVPDVTLMVEVVAPLPTSVRKEWV